VRDFARLVGRERAAPQLMLAIRQPLLCALVSWWLINA
jgi:hypothetical protein